MSYRLASETKFLKGASFSLLPFWYSIVALNTTFSAAIVSALLPVCFTNVKVRSVGVVVRLATWRTMLLDVGTISHITVIGSIRLSGVPENHLNLSVLNIVSSGEITHVTVFHWNGLRTGCLSASTLTVSHNAPMPWYMVIEGAVSELLSSADVVSLITLPREFQRIWSPTLTITSPANGATLPSSYP